MKKYLAEVDANGIVQRVIVANEKTSLPGEWVEVDKIGKITVNYPSKGMKLEKAADGRAGFSKPQPYPSWTLDKEKMIWKAPKERPTLEEDQYDWDEKLKDWVKKDRNVK